MRYRWSTAARAACTSLLAIIIVAAIAAAPTAGRAAPAAATRATAVLAGGCFWGMEAVFASLKGVSGVVAGYAGGTAETAHYEAVSTGRTGHAESVKINYDPSRISFGRLLEVYFTVAHDPTELDRQGPDAGPQYRSAIFFTTLEQKRVAEAFIRELERKQTFGRPIVTKIAPLAAFYPAEEHHQHFVARNPDQPYVVYNDLPKLKHLRARFPDLLKAGS